MFTTKLTNLYVTDVVLTTKTTHWVIEGPRALTKTLLSTKITIKIRDSCNRYRRFYIKGREQDRLKYSMPAILE
jgi:hypothetical protein